MPDEKPPSEPRELEPPPEPSAPVLPATREANSDDTPPPMVSPARGPMNQLVPDVPTGSTPLTRRDD